MRVLLINPNVTQKMTEQVVARVQQCAPAVLLDARTVSRGVSVIASRASFAVAASSVLETWAQQTAQAQAIVVACFGDPAVLALRELCSVPVYGLAEATMRAAAKRGNFAIVTAGPLWKNMLDELAHSLQLKGRYTGTYAIDATGLDAAGQPDAFRALLQGAIDDANRGGAENIILGGAALTGMNSLFKSAVPLLDCVETTMQAVLAGDYPYPLPQTAVTIASCGLDERLAAALCRQ